MRYAYLIDNNFKSITYSSSTFMLYRIHVYFYNFYNLCRSGPITLNISLTLMVIAL